MTCWQSLKHTRIVYAQLVPVLIEGAEVESCQALRSIRDKGDSACKRRLVIGTVTVKTIGCGRCIVDIFGAGGRKRDTYTQIVGSIVTAVANDNQNKCGSWSGDRIDDLGITGDSRFVILFFEVKLVAIPEGPEEINIKIACKAADAGFHGCATGDINGVEIGVINTHHQGFAFALNSVIAAEISR